ncbi:MAG TPA: hypothetical protein VN861_18955 [Candidatus Acidoferrales bacterium]|nr:hypothetical protein [Candidatus Acidoferrales bacterium]
MKTLASALAIFAMLCIGVLPVQAQKGGVGGGGGAGSGGAAATAGNANSTTGVRDTNLPSTNEKPPDVVLQNNPLLSSKLQPYLPLGMTPQEASQGYKEIGDFLTALHAAHDLGIPFLQLRCAELGKYCPPDAHAKSTKLENAIVALKPDAGKDGAKQATKAAKLETKADLQGVKVY